MALLTEPPLWAGHGAMRISQLWWPRRRAVLHGTHAGPSAPGCIATGLDCLCEVDATASFAAVRTAHLAVHAVGAVLAPELREVLQAMAPVLAAARVKLLVRILARLKQVQVLLRARDTP